LLTTLQEEDQRATFIKEGKMTEEATINPDGTQDMGGDTNTMGEEDAGEILEEAIGGLDPVYYLMLGVIVFALVVYLFRKKKSEVDDFFDGMDGDKFNLKLPSQVDEYYAVKDKCLAAGWKPGMAPPPGQQNTAKPDGHHRLLAQALMKRCISDIPIVTHIQKESPGMNKLYSQSMCSVKQWRSYQAAEALVSNEVDEVRAEADEVEPGWSQVIWKQAMQYHTMLKQKHSEEVNQAMSVASKRKTIADQVAEAKKQVADAKAEILAAEKAAEELIKAEEREKGSKKSVKAEGSMKKGFLNSTNKK